jgi:hypothetical protein
MPNKLTHEFVFECYAKENYSLNSIYKNNKTKDQLTCPVGHQIEMRFNTFQQGYRCGKCAGNEKHSHEFVFECYAKENYSLNSIYKNCRTKDQLTCPFGHQIEMRFDSFQQGGHRCLKCSGLEKLTQDYVCKFYYKENYILNSIYKNASTKDSLICPKGHEITMRFDNFKHGYRCSVCFFKKNIGENHYNFNPNRDEISLNKRLRKVFTKDWRIKYMKDDPNYNNFLSNPDDYTVDHIIPVKLFCELTVKYNLNEYKIKNIINHRDNLQLLTWRENSKKYTKGSLFEAVNYLINNGIKFENFQNIAV